MKTPIPITLLLFMLSFQALAQQTTGTLPPGSTLTNKNNETLYYMPRASVIKLLNYQTKSEIDSLRVEQYKLLSKEYQQRIILADSALTIRELEAKYWNQKLLENDQLLQQQKIINAQLQDQNQHLRSSRIYYLLAGVLATSIVFGVQ